MSKCNILTRFADSKKLPNSFKIFGESKISNFYILCFDLLKKTSNHFTILKIEILRVFICVDIL